MAIEINVTDKYGTPHAAAYARVLELRIEAANGRAILKIGHYDIPWGDQIRVIWTLAGTSTFGLSANFRL